MLKTKVQNNEARHAEFHVELAHKNAKSVGMLTLLIGSLWLAWAVGDYRWLPEQADYFSVLRVVSTIIAVLFAAMARWSNNTTAKLVFAFLWGQTWVWADVAMIPGNPHLLGHVAMLFGLQIAAASVMQWHWYWSVAFAIAVQIAGEVAMLFTEFTGYQAFSAHGYLLTGIPIATVVAKNRYDSAKREYDALQALEHEKQTSDELRAAEEEKADQLQRALDLQAKFFANVSHELRTPLTLITAPVETMLADAGASRSHSSLRVVRRNAKRLLRLIDDLLDLSRVDVGRLKLNITDVEVDELVLRVTANAEPAARARSIDLSTRTNGRCPPVLADGHRLEMVVTNLVGNALKYTPPGGRVLVSVSHAGDQVRIVVADSGPGIPIEDRAQVFDRFYRVDAAHSERVGGLGIGLSLAKELVELHGGSLSVGDGIDGGASFEVALATDGSGVSPDNVSHRVLPKESVPGVAFTLHTADGGSRLDRQAARDTKGDGENVGCVLVVEDQPDLREFIVRQLGGTCEVHSASDGNAGWSKACRIRPDLVVSDIMMPGIDGLELCRRIKQDTTLADTPVILLTARTGSENEVEAFEFGADDFIPKPFHPEVLRSRVSAHLALKKSRARLREEKKRAEALLEEVTTMRAEREQWLENLARFLRHELKNQVTATETSVKLAGTGSTSPERSRRYLDRATRSLQRMRKLVESATEATSLEAALAAGELGPVDFATLVAERGQAFREANPGKKLELLLPSSLVVRGSEVRLEQLIDKLLGNAVEHTADGDQIRITLVREALESADTAQVVLRVENDGPQLPDDKRRIFDPYVTTGGGADNTGLGLYVVKVIAEGHGGSVRAYDLHAEGATSEISGAGFEVRLP